MVGSTPSSLSEHVPFVFVSAYRQEQLPFDLRSVPFIPKPFYGAQIERALQAGIG
jgi:two-component SAPR family response regulator